MAHQYTTMVLGWIDVVNNVQPCRCSANGMRRRSDVVVLSGVYHSYTHSPQPHLTRTPHQHCRHPRTLTLSQHNTHATQATVHASQPPQQPHAHRVLRQPHKQTKDYHRTTNTTQTHRPSSKSERNLIILQVNKNGLRNKL